jgi:hypothetical protein
VLDLNDKRWTELRDAHGSAANIPPLLKQLASVPAGRGEDEPWFSLWSALAHQGDVHPASFAAVPHVVHFPAWVEICRHRKGVLVPEDLQGACREALSRLPGLVAAAAAAERSWDDTLLCAGAIHVEEQSKSGFVPKEGKRRLIPMSPLGRQVLEKLKAREADLGDDELVVPNDKGLPYIRLSMAGQKGGGTSVWKAPLPEGGREGVDVHRPALLRGADAVGQRALHVTSRWMGHSKVETTTKRYGNLAPDNADQWDFAARRETVRAVEPVKADLAG